MMIFKAIVAKIGKSEDYVGKPFFNEERKVVGSIVKCEENGDGFELTIDAELNINLDKKISFSINKK